jgi:hypothetical protein
MGSTVTQDRSFPMICAANAIYLRTATVSLSSVTSMLNRPKPIGLVSHLTDFPESAASVPEANLYSAFPEASQRKFNECHYYSLPIPGDMLERLENEPVELKVTLSYFIEPNPGLSANVDAQRYQSHGLRLICNDPESCWHSSKPE